MLWSKCIGSRTPLWSLQYYYSHLAGLRERSRSAVKEEKEGRKRKGKGGEERREKDGRAGGVKRRYGKG